MASSLNDRKYASLVEDNKTATESNINTAHGQVSAAQYTAASPTLANGDFAFLRMTSDGKLMVDTEMTVDGNVIVDNVAMYATNIADSSTTSFALVDASGHIQVDIQSAPVAETTPQDISHITTAAVAASLVIKGSAGKLFSIRGVNSSGSAQYIQVHDASSLPADTAVPKTVHYVAAGAAFSIDYLQGRSFTTGIVVCNSSTLATKTIGAADCWFDCDYE